MSFEQAVVTERVVCFGDEENLVAIVSEASPPRHVPGVLILNAGVLHRVGPHRLHVNLARRLAACGHRVARLDLSGIGDSRAMPGRMTFRESSVADISTTLGGLVTDGDSTDFILFGICSGADNALAAAQVDPRIRGLVLVDPPAYATPGSKLRHTRGRLGGKQAWLRLPVRIALTALRRGAKVFSAKLFRTLSSMPATEGGRELPPMEEYRRQLNALIQRDVRILAIYSGVLGARHNHEDQLFEAFPELKGKVDCAYFPDANHTFTELSAQAALQACVLSWFSRWEAVRR